MAHILFSALSARRGGGLTYIRNIVRAFPSGRDHHLSIISADPIEGLEMGHDVEWIRAPNWALNPISRFLFGAIYFRFVWPRRKEFDAVYFAGGSFDIALPAGVKTIVAFRNMLPFDLQSRRRYPLGWIRFRHWLLRYLQAWAFRRADLVIFISVFAQQTIDRLVPNRGNRSVVIPHGVSYTNSTLDPAIVALLPHKFVLYLSIIDVYKAQVELIEAWAQLRRTNSLTEKLVLAGPEYPPYAKQVRRAIRRHGLEDEIILLGAVPHDQVTDLASRAELNLFLSACENCPNILLELMGVGRALLVSNRQPMPELGGPDLDYVDPYDVGAVATGLARLLNDPDRREHIAVAARARAELYTWERAGALTWQAIVGCVSNERAGDGPTINSKNRQAGNVQG